MKRIKLKPCDRCGTELTLSRTIFEEWNGRSYVKDCWDVIWHTLLVECNECCVTVKRYEVQCAEDLGLPFEEFEDETENK